MLLDISNNIDINGKNAAECEFADGGNDIAKVALKVRDEGTTCFLRTRWLNRDGGTLDGHKINGKIYNEVMYLYDINQKDDKKKRVRYYYRNSPPVLVFGETFASFDEIPREQNFLVNGLKVSKQQLICDFGSNGICNSTDNDIFQAALGSCLGSPEYEPFADINGDDCISLIDSPDTDNDRITDCNDNCLTVCNTNQLDSDVDGLGDACDVSPGCGGCSQPVCEVSCDIDSDGIFNTIDNYPDKCNLQQLDFDNDTMGAKVKGIIPTVDFWRPLNC